MPCFLFYFLFLIFYGPTTQKQDLLKNERTNTEQSHYKKTSLFAMVKFFDKAQKVVPKNVLPMAKSCQMLSAKTSSKKLYC